MIWFDGRDHSGLCNHPGIKLRLGTLVSVFEFDTAKIVGN